MTSTADNGAGSLRAALGSAGGNDTIDFALNLPAVITLTTGELLVTNNVTISGPGAANLTISGGNAGRVFHAGTSNTVTISSLTIADGLVSAGGVGAGIYLENANLTLLNCVIQNNHATGGSTAHGAGIYAIQSQLTLTGCTIGSNVASGNGGGVYNIGSTVTLNRSTISGNSGLNGGGLFSAAGTTNLIGCLVSANVATHGGGVANVGALGAAALTMNNCTFSSNTVSGASATGSQVYNSRQLSATSAAIINSTILSNMVAGNYAGGAVYNENGATVTAGSSIIQTSVQEHSFVNAGAGSITSMGYNLSFDTGNGFLTGPADQISTDPLLDVGTGPRDNGGPTFTIALQANSPAIDKGKVFGSGTDQRGEPRPFNDPGVPNAVNGDGSDIGAYEADLRLTSLARVSNNLQLNFTTIVGKSYQLQSRPSLVMGGWNGVGGALAGNGGIEGSTATNAFSSAVQFYRILQTP
ncbi:MAG: choice-of-anchor Q domain-containing protein [Chthoniobacterales bacterium]